MKDCFDPGCSNQSLGEITLFKTNQEILIKTLSGI